MGSPALLEAQSFLILALLDGIAVRTANHVYGGVSSDGGTTQGSGAGTAPNIDIDLTAIVDAAIDGSPCEYAGGTDIDSDAGDQIAWGATSGKEVYGYVLLQTGTDNTSAAAPVVVFGDVAATGSGEYPSDDDITTFVTHDNWVKVCGVKVVRTGDTTITIAFYNTVGDRHVTGVCTSLAQTESDFRAV